MMEDTSLDSLIDTWMEYVLEIYPSLTTEQKESMIAGKTPLLKVISEALSSQSIEKKPERFVYSVEGDPLNFISPGFSIISMPGNSVHYISEDLNPQDIFYIYQHGPYEAKIYPPTGMKFSDGYKYKTLKKGMFIWFEYDGGVTLTVKSIFGEKKQLKPVAHSYFLELPTYTYDNGEDGIGATITGNSLGHPVYVTGQWAEEGDIVLVWTEGAYNGLYIVTNPGDDTENYYQLTRHPDMDEPDDIPGTIIFIQSSGSTMRDTIWTVADNSSWIIGTDEIDIRILNDSRFIQRFVHSYDDPLTIPSYNYPVDLFVYDGNADGTITLPLSDNGKGRFFAFKNMSSANLTISSQGTDSLDSSTTIVLSPYEYAKVADVKNGVWGRIG